MIARFSIGFIIALYLLGGRPAFGADNTTSDIEQQRRAYLDALVMVRTWDYQRYLNRMMEFDGYILLGNLEYEYLKRRIAQTPPEEIRRFLKANRHLVTSRYLRKRWLHHLAKRGDWKTFMAEYGNTGSDNTRLYCYRLARLMRTSKDQAALMADIEKLWLTGKRLPTPCNPVFKQWRKDGHMSRDLVFARIKLAMESRRLSLSRELARYLAPKDRVWVTRWIAMHRRPVRQLQQIRYSLDTPVARMIVKHGIVRLAQRDPEEAMKQWRQLHGKHRFFGEDENYVLRRVGVLAAKRHLPVAVEWLSAVSADEFDRELYQWRVRAALRARKWDMAKQFIAALTESEQQQDEWRYWRARIIEETEDFENAEELFRALARERSYYGFLAADLVGLGYSMQHRSVEVKPEEMGTLMARRDIQVARELFAVGQIVSARRQWHWITRHMNKRELQTAAVVARNWGWYDRAVFTVIKSGYLDDLDLRFPILYRDKIEYNARKSGLDLGWIYGVLRQESAFVADARSGAGALGLMQLLPRTGRATARRLKLNIRSRRAILNVDNNLRLGVYHLRTVLRQHKNNHMLATAAYNAGSYRVKRWLPDEILDADVWVDSIPFDETRDYVKNVLGFAAIYDHRLGIEHVPVSSRMPMVGPR